MHLVARQWRESRLAISIRQNGNRRTTGSSRGFSGAMVHLRMIHALHLSLHGAVSHLAVVHGWGLLLALAVAHLAMVHAARFALHGTMIHLAVIHALHRRFGGTVAHLAVVHRHGAVPHCRMIHFFRSLGNAAAECTQRHDQRYEGRA
ncbi:hypothetical protein D3C78_1573810 [compost metagenome]